MKKQQQEGREDLCGLWGCCFHFCSLCRPGVEDWQLGMSQAEASPVQIAGEN